MRLFVIFVSCGRGCVGRVSLFTLSTVTLMCFGTLIERGFETNAPQFVILLHMNKTINRIPESGTIKLRLGFCVGLYVSSHVVLWVGLYVGLLVALWLDLLWVT